MTEAQGESVHSGDTTAPSVTDPALAESPAAGEHSAGQPHAQRAGVPVWRVGKPDSFLAADVAAAREAVLSIAVAADIGKHVGARSEGVRCVTHLFESKKAGYRGWVWFATLSRISRGKESTVNEVGLLPTEDSVLAPAWVPWAERVRPEDREEEAAAEALRNRHETHDDGDHHDDPQDASASAEDDPTEDSATANGATEDHEDEAGGFGSDDESAEPWH